MIKEKILLATSGLKLLGKTSIIKIKKKLGLTIKPIFINYLVTFKCDSRCSMCHIWKIYKENPNLRKKELTLFEIEEFLKRNENFLSDVKHFGITGGEPLMREDIVEIVKLVRKYLPKATTGFQTNGLQPDLVKKRLLEIKKFYPEVNISVSLDGVGDIHDKVRGVKGAFQKVLKTFDYIKELKINRSTSGMTISELNFNQIEEVKQIVEKRGIEFSCFLADKAGYFNNDNFLNDLSVPAKKEIIDKLKANFSENYYMDNLRLQLEGKRKRSLTCYSGYTSIVIDPYGNVKPCILKEESFGNIKDKLLEDLLSNQHACNLRRRLKKCRCWNQCEVSSSAMIDIFDVFRWFVGSHGKKKFLEHLFIVQKDLKL